MVISSVAKKKLLKLKKYDGISNYYDVKYFKDYSEIIFGHQFSFLLVLFDQLARVL